MLYGFYFIFFFALLNLLIYKNILLFNNGFIYIKRKSPKDEDLEAEAEELDERNSPDENVRREAEKRIKETYGFDPNNSEGERKCQTIEKSIEREFKRRRLERDEHNDKAGVERAGYSSSVTPISDDSDHRQLKEDEVNYIEKRMSEYIEKHSHESDYNEKDAVEFAKDSLKKLYDSYDNPDTDHTETDNEHETTSEPDTEDELSDSRDGSDKGTNTSTKIKDIVKRGGG